MHGIEFQATIHNGMIEVPLQRFIFGKLSSFITMMPIKEHRIRCADKERNMLLLDIEEHIKPLSTSEKKQLIRDIQKMLGEQEMPVIDGPKFHPDWNFNEMYEVAENLQAWEKTLTGPKYLDESALIYEKDCDV